MPRQMNGPLLRMKYSQDYQQVNHRRNRMSKPSQHKAMKQAKRRKALTRTKNQMRNQGLVMMPLRKVTALQKQGINPKTVGKKTPMQLPGLLAQQLAKLLSFKSK
jgi:hypothetical protein